jgi:hypothetical protein
LDDNSERPWLIETIPKRGYRLVAPVVTGCEPASGNVVSAEATRQAIDADRRSGRRPAWQWVGATAIALATAGVFVAVVPRDRFSFVFGPEDERIRLAVLPFTNLMGRPCPGIL